MENSNRKDLGVFLQDKKDELAKRVIEKQWELHPEFDTIFDAEGRKKCLEDTKYHISYLSDACLHNSVTLFKEYTSWLKVLMDSLGISLDSVKENYKILGETIEQAGPLGIGEKAKKILKESLDYAFSQPKEPESYLSPDKPLGEEAMNCLNLLLGGRRREASDEIIRLTEEGVTPKELYLNLFQPIQLEVGRLWHINKISVAQEHFVTASVNMLISQLYPLIFSSQRNGKSFIGASIGKELHEIGIRMVTDFLEMEGWDTYFIGSNTPVSTVLNEIKTKKPDLLGLSVTISAHLKDLSSLVSLIREDPEIASIPILVGGYPFNLDKDLWEKMGADGYAKDAEEAVRLSEDLV